MNNQSGLRPRELEPAIVSLKRLLEESQKLETTMRDSIDARHEQIKALDAAQEEDVRIMKKATIEVAAYKRAIRELSGGSRFYSY